MAVRHKRITILIQSCTIFEVYTLPFYDQQIFFYFVAFNIVHFIFSYFVYIHKCRANLVANFEYLVVDISVWRSIANRSTFPVTHKYDHRAHL